MYARVRRRPSARSRVSAVRAHSVTGVYYRHLYCAVTGGRSDYSIHKNLRLLPFLP